jgi:large subunit ribosomal protein L23
MALFGTKKEEEKDSEPISEQKPEKSSVSKKSVKKATASTGKALSRKDFTILRSPIITEKAARLSEKGTYTFKVATAANKIEIRHAVEKLYNVAVRNVRTVHVPGHEVRRGRNTGWRAGYKKAMVTLQEGHKIEIV